MTLRSGHKSIIKGSIAILDTNKTVYSEISTLNKEFELQINFILQELLSSNSSNNIEASPGGPSEPTRQDLARKSFKRKRGSRPLKRKERYKSMEEIESELQESSPGKPAWFKKLYRSMMRATHPDILSKELAPAEREKLISWGMEAIQYYGSNNHLELIRVASYIDLFAEMPFIDQKQMIIKECEKIQKDLKSIETRVSWVWGYCCQTIDEQIRVLNDACRQKNIQIPPKETMQKLIEKYSK